jgi:hypothetical protein
MNQDLDHLRLLSIFHYVFGGLAAFFSFFPLIYVVMGAVFLFAPDGMGFGPGPDMGEMEAFPAEIPVGGEGDMGEVAPDDPFAGAPVASDPFDDASARNFVGGMLIAMGSLFFVIGLVCAVLVIMAGRNLAAQRGYTFCLVIAALECLSVPIGTALGVFTIVVLQRESVKELFAQRRAEMQSDPYGPPAR